MSTWQDRLLLCDQNVGSAVSGTRRSQCCSFTQNPAERRTGEQQTVCHCTVYVFLYVCMIENRKQKEDVGDNGEKTEAIANK